MGLYMKGDSEHIQVTEELLCESKDLAGLVDS